MTFTFSALFSNMSIICLIVISCDISATTTTTVIMNGYISTVVNTKATYYLAFTMLTTAVFPVLLATSVTIIILTY